MRSPLCTALVFLVLAFAGCKDEATSPDSRPEPVEFRNALLPFALGNQWTYVDSLFTESSVSVETYSVAVIDFRIEGDNVWWQIQDSRTPGSTIEYAVRNDSVLNLQYNFQHPVESLEYIPAPAADTVYFSSLVGGDVMVSKYACQASFPVTVPAGTFTGCASTGIQGGYLEILKPQLGIIQKEVQYEGAFRKSVLIGYEVRR